MNTKSTPPGSLASALSPSTVALTLCITFACPFAPSVAASDSDTEIEDEGNPQGAVDSIEDIDGEHEQTDDQDETDDGEEYTEGLVWIVETEVVQIDLLNETENTNPSTTETYRESSIELSAQWYGSLTDVSQGFFDVSLFHERLHEPLRPSMSESFIELNEIWIENRLHGFDSSIRVGLQSFEDNRGWWWDDEVVSAHWLGHSRSDWDYSVAALKSTGDYNNRDEPADPEEQDIYYLLLRGQTNLGDNSALTLYGLHRADRSGRPAIGTSIPSGFEDESDATLTHLGLGVEHEVDIGALGSLSLRGDIAILSGDDRRVIYDDGEAAHEDIEDTEDEEAAQDEDTPGNDLATEQEILQVTGMTKTNINAWAADFGVNWELPIGLKPVIELGFAVGSGTSADQTEGSKTFRQTGLHDNSQGQGIYGNVLMPELSNLQILSAAVSIPIADSGGIRLYHHGFRKMRVNGEIAENELDLETEFESSEIGNETGLYLQFDVLEDVEIQFTVAQFRYRRAVTKTTKSRANRFSLEVSYEF